MFFIYNPRLVSKAGRRRFDPGLPLLCFHRFIGVFFGKKSTTVRLLRRPNPAEFSPDDDSSVVRAFLTCTRFVLNGRFTTAQQSYFRHCRCFPSLSMDRCNASVLLCRYSFW
jgi:hypothetical protein